MDVREGIQLPLHGVAIDWYYSDLLVQHFSRSDNTLELKKFSIYASTLSLNTPPARSCRTLHYCPRHPHGRSWSASMAQPFTFCLFHFDLWCYQDRKAKWVCSAWSRLGWDTSESWCWVVFRGGPGGGEQTAMFLRTAQFWSLTQCCGKASCCNLWLYKGGEWRVEPTLHLYDWYTNAWSCSSIHIFKSC